LSAFNRKSGFSRKARSFIQTLGAMILVMASCSPSLVYSPSLQVPEAPLSRGQFQAGGGIGMLAEARPNEINHKTSGGAEFFSWFAISRSVALQAKWWKDISDHNPANRNRNGVSLAAIVTVKSTASAGRLAVMPQAALLLDGGSAEGNGLACALIYWPPGIGSFHPYIALRPVFGMRNIYGSGEWGWGVIGNMGIAISLAKTFRVNMEAAGIRQVNKYDRRTDDIFAPGITVSAAF